MVASASPAIRPIELSLLRESPLNPRRHFAGIDDLARSLARQQFDPIVVRPHPTETGCFELANGARRFRAARLAKLPALDARVYELSDGEMLDIILGTGAEANVNSLTPIEEGEGYAEAMKLLDLTLEQCAERFGREATYVWRRLSLLDLPLLARDAVESGDLPAMTAWLIARIPGKAIREETAKAIIHSELYGGVMPFRAAEIYINKVVCRTLQGAPFPVDDAELMPSAGACSKCPYRAGNDKATYGDVKNPHTCMHPACYEEKVSAARARVLAKEVAAGKEALPEGVNTEIFPDGAKGLSWKSDYVAFTQPIARDLIKPEVTDVPTWKDLCEDRGVRIYVGFDQEGRAIDVAKLAEAIVAVAPKETAIFTDMVRRRYLLESAKSAPQPEKRLEKPRKPKASPPPAPVAETPAPRPDDPTLSLLGRLLCAPGQHENYFELRIAETSAAFRLAAGDSWPKDDEMWAFCEYDFDATGFCAGRLVFDRQRLTRGLVVHECTHAALEFGAHKVMTSAAVQAMQEDAQHDYWSEMVPQITQILFEQAEALIWTENAPVIAAEPAITPATEKSTTRLAEWARMHAAGMSAQKIAATDHVSLEDVCGALSLDVHQARNEFSQLRQDAEEAFQAAGLQTTATRDRVTAVATNAPSFAEISTPEQLRALLRMLSQRSQSTSTPTTNEGDE